MSEHAAHAAAPAAATFELLWQQDASAFALVRGPDGTLSAGDLQLGMAAVADLCLAGRRGVAARLVELDELLDLVDDAPAGLVPGGSALIVFEVVRAARRSVASGLVHPHLEAADGRWHALWGATLDERVRDELAALAHAAPAAAADAFDGDTDALVHDLYGCAVDELARRALRTVPMVPAVAGRRASGAVEHFLAGLAAPSPALPAHTGYPALERRLAAWVDEGLSRRSRAPWNLCLRLDEQETGGAVVLELWLEAADDPTLALPASLLRDGSDEVFAFLRESDPRRALELRLQLIAPVLEAAGIELRATRRAPSSSTTRRSARSCERRSRGSSSSASRCASRANGWRRRAGSASTS